MTQNELLTTIMVSFSEAGTSKLDPFWNKGHKTNHL